MRHLKPGNIVAVHWIDSGCDTGSRDTELARCVTYGRVSEVTKDTLRLEMDVCVRKDGSVDEEHRNRWGLIWLPAITRVVRLEPK